MALVAVRREVLEANVLKCTEKGCQVHNWDRNISQLTVVVKGVADDENPNNERHQRLS